MKYLADPITISVSHCHPSEASLKALINTPLKPLTYLAPFFPHEITPVGGGSHPSIRRHLKNLGFAKRTESTLSEKCLQKVQRKINYSRSHLGK